MPLRSVCVLLSVMVTTVLVAACGSPSTAATPTTTPESTPLAASPTPTTTPTPTPTAVPSPTATPVTLVSRIDISELSCVDFYPGVFNPDGPNHWYHISGSLVNSGDARANVHSSVQILDADLTVLFDAQMESRSVGAGESVAFNESYAIEPLGGHSRCRVLLTVEGDLPGAEKAVQSELEALYAP